MILDDRFAKCGLWGKLGEGYKGSVSFLTTTCKSTVTLIKETVVFLNIKINNKTYYKLIYIKQNEAIHTKTKVYLYMYAGRTQMLSITYSLGEVSIQQALLYTHAHTHTRKPRSWGPQMRYSMWRHTTVTVPEVKVHDPSAAPPRLRHVRGSNATQWQRKKTNHSHGAVKFSIFWKPFMTET